MAQIAWTRRALRNWREIVQYIGRDSPARAAKVGKRLMQATERLARSPRIGARVLEYDFDRVRELVTVKPYRIIYLVRDDICYIVAIVHASRDLQTFLSLAEIEET